MNAPGAPPRTASWTALPSPHRIVDRGAAGLRAARERTAALSDIRFAGSPENFHFSLTTFTLMPALLLEAHVARLAYERAAHHVAAGDGHYLVVTYLRGESHLRGAGGELTVSPGDIAIMDLACPSQSDVVPPGDGGLAHHLTLLFPRAELAPLLASPDGVGAQRIRGDTGYGRILHGLMLALWREVAHLDVAEAARMTHAIAGLIAGALRPAPERTDDVSRAELTARRAAIQRHLDAEADPAEDIDVEALGRRFGMSRASLYRMFEAEGGLVHYLRQRRLARALDVLASPAHRHRRVLDIAVQHGFRTESGFIRAFRRRFGITPGEVRAGQRATGPRG